MKKPAQAEFEAAKKVLTEACHGILSEYFVAAAIVGVNGRLKAERALSFPDLGSGIVMRVQVESSDYRKKEKAHD